MKKLYKLLLVIMLLGAAPKLFGQALIYRVMFSGDYSSAGGWNCYNGNASVYTTFMRGDYSSIWNKMQYGVYLPGPSSYGDNFYTEELPAHVYFSASAGTGNTTAQGPVTQTFDEYGYSTTELVDYGNVTNPGSEGTGSCTATLRATVTIIQMYLRLWNVKSKTAFCQDEYVEFNFPFAADRITWEAANTGEYFRTVTWVNGSQFRGTAADFASIGIDITKNISIRAIADFGDVRYKYSDEPTFHFTDAVPAPAVVKKDPLCFGGEGSFTFSDFRYGSGAAYDGTKTLNLTLTSPAKTYNVAVNSTAPVTVNVIPGVYSMYIENEASECPRTISLPEVKGIQQDLSATTSLSCVDGKPAAAVNVAGGTAPYTYALNGGGRVSTNLFTSLAPATTYTITYYDANDCNKTVTVTTPAAISITSYSTKAPSGGASDGEISVTATGGTVPYTYNFNNGNWQNSNVFSNLPQGSYNISVRDASGCLLPTPVTVVLEQLDFTAASTPVSCVGIEDGRINLNITGGTSPYKIKLDNGVYRTNDNLFTGLAAGTYEVWVMDNKNVEAHHTVTVGSPTPVTFTYTATNPLCKGDGDGQVIITAAGGTGVFKYINVGIGDQNTNVFSLPAGTYNFRVDDSKGCSSPTTQIVITEPANKVSATYQTKDALCFNAATGEILNIQGQYGDGNYQFSLDNYTWNAATTFSQLRSGNYTIFVKDGKGCTNSVPGVTINNPLPISLVLAKDITPASCNGGTNGEIEVAATGGTGNLRFFISNNPTVPNTTGRFANLPAGTYSIIARDDNGCEAQISSLLVSQPTALQMTLASTNALCFGQANGTVSVNSMFGGNGGYTFSRDDISYGVTSVFQNLAAGNYTVYGKDDKGCRVNATVTVGQPALLSFTTTVTPVLCNGESNGTITINGAGGTLPYMYGLDNNTFQAANVFNVKAGNPKVIIQDKNGCQQSTTLQVNEPAKLTASVTDLKQVSCNSGANGAITVTATGGTMPYQYSLNGVTYVNGNIFTGLGTGNYTITIRDAANCTTQVNAVMTAPTAIGYTLLRKTDILCAGTSTGEIQLEATGGAGGYSYSFDGGTAQSNPTWTNLGKKNYPIVITDANNCTATVNIPIVELYQPLTMMLSSTPPLNCTDKGSISVTQAQGGLSPYQYNLDNSNYKTSPVFNDLVNGEHIVFLKDAAGCTTSQNISLYGPSAIRGNIATTAATCFGKSNGTVVISNVTGGSGTYEYSLDGNTWQSSPTFNNLAGDKTYQVTVRDIPFSCLVQLSAAVAQPAALQTTVLSTKDVSCFGLSDGLISLTTSGGTPGYTYAMGTGTPQSTGNYTNLKAGTYSITVTDNSGCTSSQQVTVNQPDQLTAGIASVKNIDCFGNGNGEIMLNAAGGTQPYTFKLNNTSQSSAYFGALSGGNYQLTVTDKQGCTVPLQATITEPAKLQATFTSKDINCFGSASGEIVLTATGGKGAYIYTLNNLPYQMDNTFRNLTAGNYLVSVSDENRCIVSQNVALAQPQPLSFTKDFHHPVCSYSADGSIQVALIGGVAPYSYSWSNGSNATTPLITGLKGAVYEVLMQDANGCQLTDKTVLTQPAVIPLNLGFTDTTLCVGQEIQLSTGNIGSSYEWKAGSEVLSTTADVKLSKDGKYTVTVKNAAGCVAQENFSITTSLTALKTDFLMSSYNTLGDTLILVDVTQPKPSSLKWTLPERITEISSSGDGSVKQLIFKQVGSYDITLTSQLAQCSDAITKTVIVVPVEERQTIDSVLGYREKLIRNITIFPNPTTGQFKVDVELSRAAAITVRLIYFNDGKLMEIKQSAIGTGHSVPFNIGYLPQGIYLIGVEAEKEYEVKKFMKL
ncbi:Por secretion system C-terminal sorting domain-containing protein [Chitinophaga jiangningensis]|uniref:Por secretion system C-terminal sorting domain-containing protein n=1 Tax=Chitinophaga jiangningensis TaxID=1419482 RepID=A0A1M6YBA4_9BACT|nr:T9SS type A sorting domain-containing protein [Chitinophaga jiangningensis]SHL15422.1 Por secretion system C-terminal sorting domain-containing protein [Chitinophaga jiangningensis]